MEESVKKVDGLDSFCNWALLYFHLDVNKMSFLRASVKKQALITKEGGDEKQDSQKEKKKKKIHKKAKIKV